MPAWLEALPRWGGYLGTFLVIGACVFRFAVLRAWMGAHAEDEAVAAALARRAALCGLAGACLLLAAIGPRLWFQAAGFVDPGQPIDRELLALVLGETAWGRGWMSQFAAAIVATLGFLIAVLVPRWGWIGAGIGATLVALAAPLTGHAVSEAAGRSGVVLDALHVLGGGAWLGTLAVTLLAGLQVFRRLPDAEHGRFAARLIAAFSPVALVGATLVVLAGAALSWRYLGGTVAERLAALTGSAWGRALLFKIATLGGVAALGAWNWRVLLPTLGTADAAGRLRRSARLELALGLLLLLITAIMVARPMPALAAGEGADAVGLRTCTETLAC